MDARARRVTTRYGFGAAGVAFLFGSLPLLDEVVVVPVHYALCVRLARLRGFPVLRLPWRQIKKIIWYGAAARTTIALSLSLIPFAGGLFNWITAYALTEFLSRYLTEAMDHPDLPPPDITPEQIARLFQDAEQAARNRAQDGR